MSETLQTFKSLERAGFNEELAMTTAERLNRLKTFDEKLEREIEKHREREAELVVTNRILISLVVAIFILVAKIAFFNT